MQRRYFAGFVLLLLLGLGRIVSTYKSVSVTSDEIPNLACGMQWLDQGQYSYGPFHPPLARIAIAIGPYLSGLRSQHKPDRWQEGNAILDSAPRYKHALTLARLGILPFFVLACVVVWLWARRLAGEAGALIAVLLFSNVPPVLAHAGLATTDMALTACVAFALYGFYRWLEQPNWRTAALLGVGSALAFLCKFSGALFIAMGGLAMLVLYGLSREHNRGRAKQFAAAAAIAFVIIWGAYRFSFGRMSETVDASATSEGSILARTAGAVVRVVHTVPVPAPAIFDGLLIVRDHDAGGHAAYLLGQNRTSGWWYFFPVALGVKSPLGFLLLVFAGGFALVVGFRRRVDWRMWAPASAALAILISCLPAHLNIGVRYVLPMFPMLAIAAAIGFVYLWQRGRAARIIACGLVAWTVLSSLFAHPDYIPYFNELAGRHPERVLVDSDLDWGQDMGRLAEKLRAHRATHVYLACLYTATIDKLGFPPWDGLEPYKPVKGWVAVSQTELKTFAWAIAQQQGRKDLPYAWLNAYQPVDHAGKSILIYHIADE